MKKLMITAATTAGLVLGGAGMALAGGTGATSANGALPRTPHTTTMNSASVPTMNGTKTPTTSNDSAMDSGAANGSSGMGATSRMGSSDVHARTAKGLTPAGGHG